LDDRQRCGRALCNLGIWSFAVKDAIDKLAESVKKTTVETCAKVAEIHRIQEIRPPDNLYQQGYNDAVRDIAAKIRRLK
jgi:hypothetical protein